MFDSFVIEFSNVTDVLAKPRLFNWILCYLLARTNMKFDIFFLDSPLLGWNINCWHLGCASLFFVAAFIVLFEDTTHRGLNDGEVQKKRPSQIG